MDFKQLQSFVAVVQSGSFAQAASSYSSHSRQ